jgi:FKBP-type peptidyl-prolyl cis-trans isomerase
MSLASLKTRSRHVLTAVLVAGLGVATLAPAEPPADAPKPAAPAPAPAATPAPADAPAAPKGIPVPDGPVIQKQDLEGGLIVEDIKLGDGYTVKAGDTVVAHYHGTLKADPTVVFDSSFERSEPIAFPLTGVIEGWQKGVPGMKIGGIRRLTIPAKMAYGEQAREKIPANSDLVFIIQLVDALQIEDIKTGEGEAATSPCIAAVSQVIKDESGKEVDRCDAAQPFIWIPGEIMDPQTGTEPMQMALAGMKVGGKRKVTIPGQLNNTPPVLTVKRPSGQRITIEFELISIRNLPQQRGQGGR